MKVYAKTEVDETFSDWQSDLDELSVIEAIPITENPTNGDMIKAMFPNAKFDNALPFTDGRWETINMGGGGDKRMHL